MGRHDVPLPDASPYEPYRPVVAAGLEAPYEPRIHNRPAPGHWDRIVVDAAAPQFQARWPHGRFRPDTVCDGWATRGCTVRLASVRGDAHRHGGIPRQDSVCAMVHPGTGTVLFAVMDGVSSAAQSAVGADTVGDAVLRALWRRTDDGRAAGWRDVFQAAADALLEHRPYGQQADEAVADVERRLGTTVVAGTVRPAGGGHAVTVARVGDSGAWVLRDGRYTPLFAPKGGGSPTVTSAVSALPRLPERIEVHETLLPPGSVLIAATDGIGDPLGDGTGLVGQLFAEVLATPPPILGLAHAVDFSRETFDDDRTLLAVWPNP